MPISTRQRLLELLRQRAFRQGEFTLSSGEKSDYYIDGKMIEVHPEGAALIGQAFYEHIRDLKVDAIGGLAVGAIPLVAATVVICHQHGQTLEGFWVRNEVKEHGTKKLIEGCLPHRARVVIVDDVITSGESAFKAIRAVEALGASVVKVLCLVDRQRGAAERFRQAGYSYEPLFTKDELFVRQPAG
jgi:orotate phosphoribosyltransferase